MHEVRRRKSDLLGHRPAWTENPVTRFGRTADISGCATGCRVAFSTAFVTAREA
jgi:hypothetical protein